jgi:SAM-dependent methyltransferase
MDTEGIKEKWDADFIKYFHDRKAKFRKDRAVLKRLGMFNQNKGSRILELFCGRGECQELLADYGYPNLFGIDISQTLIRCARADNRIQACNSVRLCYKPDTFDVVLVNEGLHHLKGIEEIKRCFSEVKRVLKNNGLFVFYEPANTFIRNFTVKVIFSPFGSISKKANLLRDIMRQEMPEYSYWLKNTPQMLRILEGMGFHVSKCERTFIHMAIVSRLENKV